jgi:hypothetical protein
VSIITQKIGKMGKILARQRVAFAEHRGAEQD